MRRAASENSTSIGHFRLPALFVLLCLASACVKWVPSTLPPRQLIEQEEPSSVRVTTASGDQEVIQDPVIRSDTLMTIAVDCRIDVARQQRICSGGGRSRIALADVTAIELPEDDRAATVVLGIGGAVVLVALAMGIFGGLFDCDDPANVNTFWCSGSR